MKDKALVDALANTLREDYNSPSIEEGMLERFAVRLVVHSIAGVLDEHGYCDKTEFYNSVVRGSEWRGGSAGGGGQRVSSINTLATVVRTHIATQLRTNGKVDPNLVQLVDDLDKAYAATEKDWDSRLFWMACGL